MTNYTNAPASPSALFDNTPTTDGNHDPLFRHGIGAAFCAVAAANRVPATRISMVKGGRWVAVDVLMQYGRPVPLALALKRVGIGRTVFVAREDAGAVLDAVNGLGVANGETA